MSFRVLVFCRGNLGNDWFTIYRHYNWPLHNICPEITDKINQSPETNKTLKIANTARGNKVLAKLITAVNVIWFGGPSINLLAPLLVWILHPTAWYACLPLKLTLAILNSLRNKLKLNITYNRGLQVPLCSRMFMHI